MASGVGACGEVIAVAYSQDSSFTSDESGQMGGVGGNAMEAQPSLSKEVTMSGQLRPTERTPLLKLFCDAILNRFSARIRFSTPVRSKVLSSALK